MSIAEKVVARLAAFNQELREGERIVCTTTEACRCDNPVKCKECGGRGWVFGSATIVAGEVRSSDYHPKEDAE